MSTHKSIEDLLLETLDALAQLRPGRLFPTEGRTA